MHDTLLSKAWAALAGSVVVNLLWQGMIVGIVVAVALTLTRGRSPNARYALACLGLLLMAALLPANFVWLATRGTVVSPAAATPVAAQLSPTSALPESALARTDPTDPTDQSDPSDSSAPNPLTRPRLFATQWYHLSLPWLGRLWAAGIVCFAIYDLAGLFALRRLRAKSEAVGEDIAALARRVQERLGVRVRVQVRWLAGISSALVTGFFRTVVLLPASMATRMTPGEIEAILAHEFAHIRRWDLWVNAFQRVVEALLFFHPAVWWLSKTIRAERELCCDELALRVYPDRAQYVRALLTLAETTRQPEALALSSHGGSLVDRVRRILSEKNPVVLPAGGKAIAAISVTCLIAIFLVAAHAFGEPQGETSVPSFSLTQRGTHTRNQATGPQKDVALEVHTLLSTLLEDPSSNETLWPEAKKQRLTQLLPKAADVLFAIVLREDGDMLIRKRAISALLELWTELPRDRLEEFFAKSARPSIQVRPQYPAGVEAYIGTRYQFPYGIGYPGFEDQLKIHTVTRRTLDGEEIGEPFEYDGSSAGTGWVPVQNLAPGPHTLVMPIGFTISCKGRVIEGIIDSPPATFEVVPPLTDALAAPADPELDRQVRDSLRITEVSSQEEGVIRGGGFNPRDPWKPQVSWREPDGQEVYLRVPVWDLSQPLPVDLCFDVEFHLQGTEEVFRGDALIATKGQNHGGYFRLDNTRDFVAGRESFIPVRLVLKPSQSVALSNVDVTHYYNGPPIETGVLRAHVARYPAEPTEPWLRDMRVMLNELRREGKTSRIMTNSLEGLTSTNPDRRVETARHFRFGTLSDGRAAAIPFLIRLLEDSTRAFATTPGDAAQYGLGGLGEPAIAPLAEALAHDNLDVRRRAAYALNDMGGDEELREKLVATALDPLVAHLRDPDEQVREASAHALHRFRDPRAVEPLVRALDDESPKVRANAAMALRWNRDSRATSRLIKALDDAETDVRANAAVALGQLPGKEAVGPLIDSLKDDDSRVRREAARSLGYLHDDRAVPALLDAMSDDARDVVTAAVYALGELKAEAAIEVLIDRMDAENEILEGPSPGMNRHVAEALRKITGLGFGENPKRWREWLQSTYAKDPLTSRLDEILEALRQRNRQYTAAPLHIAFSRSANDLADSPPRRTEHTYEAQNNNIREVIRTSNGTSLERFNVGGNRVEIGHHPERFYGVPDGDNAARRLRYLAHDVQHQSEATVGLWVNGPPAWLINHFRESAATGHLTIESESVNGIDCVTLSAGGMVLSLAPEYDWSPVRFNNVRGAQFAQHGELWFPSKIQQEFTYNSMSDPPFAHHTEEIIINEVSVGTDYRSRGYWSILQPQDGDYVQVAYPVWEANWDIVKGLRVEVDPRVVRDACRNEHAFFWSDKLAEEDRLIWAVSIHWRNSRRIDSALRTDQVHGDMGQAPLPFYDASEKEIVWANYTGPMIRVSTLPAEQELAIGAFRVLAAFQPGAERVHVGEPLSVSFSVRNLGQDPCFLVIQGSQRGDRDDRYQFWAFDEQGMPAQIKWEAAHFGGLMGQLPRLAPGETWGETLELEKWIAFDRPGVYTVRGRRVVQLMDKEGFPDASEPQIPFFADFQVQVVSKSR